MGDRERGAQDRRAGRCRHLDGLGDPGFPGPQGVWTKDPSAEKLATFDNYVSDPAVRERAWQSRLSSPTWDAKAQSGPSGAPRARDEGRARAPGDPERRRPPSDGGSRPFPGRRDPRHDEENRLPALRATTPHFCRPRASGRGRGGPRLHVGRRPKGPATGSSSRTRSASGRTWS